MGGDESCRTNNSRSEFEDVDISINNEIVVLNVLDDVGEAVAEPADTRNVYTDACASCVCVCVFFNSTLILTGGLPVYTTSKHVNTPGKTNGHSRYT